MFRKAQKVYFGHIDPAGIVYHPWFIDYFQQAYEDFLSSLSLGEKPILERFGVRFPVVNVNVDYFRPAKPGDLLTIELSVKRIGTKSITLHFRTTLPDGALIAEGDVVRVAIDREFKSCAIPSDLRAAFEKHIPPQGGR
ncbi:MAG: acyl-CoA thioesterase [Methanobacteriota archaeon]